MQYRFQSYSNCNNKVNNKKKKITSNGLNNELNDINTMFLKRV